MRTSWRRSVAARNPSSVSYTSFYTRVYEGEEVWFQELFGPRRMTRSGTWAAPRFVPERFNQGKKELGFGFSPKLFVSTPFLQQSAPTSTSVGRVFSSPHVQSH